MEVSRILVHCPVHSETHSQQREGRELDDVGRRQDTHVNGAIHVQVLLVKLI